MAVGTAAHARRELGFSFSWRVVDRLFEVAHAVADGFAQLRQFAWSEDNQNDDEDDDQMPRLQYAHRVFSRTPTIPCEPALLNAGFALRSTVMPRAAEPPIHVQHLSKVFRVHEREEGISAT